MVSSAQERRRALALAAEGDRARGAGDRAGAERSFREALSLFALLEDPPAAARMLADLADLHLMAGDYAGATALRRQAIERHPYDVEALTGLGYAQWLGGSPADAEVTLSQALKWDRCAVRALALRGQIRADLGDYRGALQDLDDALELGPHPEDERDVRSARALAMAGLGRIAEAQAQIAIDVGVAPEAPRTRLRAARIALLADRPDQAREHLRIMQTLDPHTPETQAARKLLTRLTS
jgi:tetratricopeptide (TPR) repeat protein